MSTRRLRQSAQTLSSIQELDRLRLAVLATGQAVYDWSVPSDQVSWSENAGEILAPNLAKAFSNHGALRGLIDEDAARFFADLVAHPPQDGASFCVEYQLRHPSGTNLWIEDRGVCLRNGEQLERIVGSVRDITARKTSEARLHYLGAHDELTGQLNRTRLREKLAEAIARAETENGTCLFAVAAIDGLAGLNGAYGFDVADEVIIAISRRLGAALRPQDTIGRVGGNKFGLIFEGRARNEAGEIANRLRETVSGSVIPTSAGKVSVTISMGFVCAPLDGGTSQDVMLQAEEALDRAKAQGRDNFDVFVPSTARASTRRRNAALGEQVVDALNERRLLLAFQPIVEAETGRPALHECLLRMVKPDGSIAAAGEFIPVCEQLGLVRIVDRRVLEMAVEVLIKEPAACLSVNVSGFSVGDAAWLKLYEDLVRHRPDVPARLTVELTETAALNDLDDSADFVAQLRKSGAKVAIDDFGAGYTSFRNLQRLDVDLVKIDGEFVRDLEANADNQTFVRTLIELAKNFHLSTCAEWVGSEADAEILRSYGVNYLQGALYGMPDLSPTWLRS